MFRVIYKVPIDQQQAEQEWLQDQMIVFALEIEYDFWNSKQFAKFGMIVTPEILTMIKLRHTPEVVIPYSTKRSR